ncbi:hypothetical protein NEICINOT_04196 [Neisseria cinerea ATCC 14685]|uniref:Uncharacterized protein n=1 Tax=Neisseria cinerea ATCC 14685 TaxID=546262 RepID=D0W3F8_NEICI|nr:hypothetical protein NEICINOT_04196 [Neisseria cinerea ATCC 14685]
MVAFNERNSYLHHTPAQYGCQVAKRPSETGFVVFRRHLFRLSHHVNMPYTR